MLAVLGGLETTGPIARWTSDYSTAIGQQRVVTLADGSVAHMNTASAFSVDFSRQPDSGGGQRLVWNHLKAGLSLSADGLVVQVATADQGLKSFAIKGLGLNDTDKHNAAVLIDAMHDRLQVVLDDNVVLDVSNVDFDIVGAGGREWGWTLGSAWNHDFTGDVYAFSVDTHFDFIDTSASHTSLA